MTHNSQHSCVVNRSPKDPWEDTKMLTVFFFCSTIFSKSFIRNFCSKECEKEAIDKLEENDEKEKKELQEFEKIEKIKIEEKKLNETSFILILSHNYTSILTSSMAKIDQTSETLK